MPVIQVAIAQMNACLGDFAANAQTIVAAAKQAAAQEADLLLTRNCHSADTRQKICCCALVFTKPVLRR